MPQRNVSCLTDSSLFYLNAVNFTHFGNSDYNVFLFECKQFIIGFCFLYKNADDFVQISLNHNLQLLNRRTPLIAG